MNRRIFTIKPVLIAVVCLCPAIFGASCGQSGTSEEQTVDAPNTLPPERREGPGNEKPDFWSEASIALRQKDWAGLKELVRANPELAKLAFLRRERTLLHEAARAGRKDMVAMLISNGADIHAKTKGGGTNALYFAAFNAHHDTAILLLQKGATLEKPIVDAVIARDVEIIRKLLDKDRELLHAGDYFRKGSALHWAALLGYENIVQLLLEYGASVHEKARGDNSPLHYAALAGSKTVINLLIDAGADVNVEDKYRGLTPLHWAAKTGDVEIARLLISKGARVKAKKYCRTTLMQIAAVRGDIDLAELLINNGANVDGSDNDHKGTPIHGAASGGKTEMVKFLIGKGANVRAKDEYGSTPLHDAAYRGSTEIVGILLHNGAEVSAKDKFGDTPLHKASECGREKVVGILIKAGADVNERNIRERTPLHTAVYYKRKDILEVLIDKGADLSIKDCNNRTPLEVAVLIGHKDIADLLKKHGAEK